MVVVTSELSDFNTVPSLFCVINEKQLNRIKTEAFCGSAN